MLSSQGRREKKLYSSQTAAHCVVRILTVLPANAAFTVTLPRKTSDLRQRGTNEGSQEGEPLKFPPTRQSHDVSACAVSFLFEGEDE